MYIFLSIFGLAFSVFLMRGYDSKVLTLIIILTLWGAIGYHFLSSAKEKSSLDMENKENKVLDIPSDYPIENSGNLVDLQHIPKLGFRYLKQNQTLLGILHDLRFTRMYDKARFQNLIFQMDRLQKSYMYMLSRRSRIQEAMPLFHDLNNSIRETLYSFYVVVPLRLRHTYGLRPHEVLKTNIQLFTGVTRRMIDILRNFSIHELNLPYFPEDVPSGIEKGKENVLP